MLLGNKKDLKQRKISYTKAMQYARKMNFGYCEVSAKTGYGVQEAFSRLVTEIYKFQTLEFSADE